MSTPPKVSGDTTRSANPIDSHVGARMRTRRVALGMSQEKLGAALGLTFQQVQKYERGNNRISASRLFDLARVLDVPVTFFFDAMPDDLLRQAPAPLPQALRHSPAKAMTADPALCREMFDLIRAYNRIREPKIRSRVFELAKSLNGVA